MGLAEREGPVSATNRGTTRDPKDFYATPKAAFEPLLKILPPTLASDCADNLFCYHEPCAGDGRLIRWLKESGRRAKGSDLYPQSCEEYLPIPVDYLKDTMPYQFVISNPPFSVAFEMCQHALAHSREFMFLLRLSFLESDTRGDWLSAHEPNGLWVLKKRPSFVMSVTCKSDVPIMGGVRTCKHNWMLPIESERPKQCPKCQGCKLSISTSDNSGYAWFYWGPRVSLQGIHHI